MKGSRPAKLLRVHFSERDHCGDKPLYEAIVDKCRESGIAGATVFRGLEGFGQSEIHRPHLFTHDLPIVVTIVDSEENVQRLLPLIEEIMDSGVIAIADVECLRINKTLGP